MRLIDADALSTKFIFVCEDGYDGADMVLKKDIDNAPTIEAEPVKHGRWEEYWDDAYLTYFYRCSECKADAPSKRDTMLDQLLTPYCQHCGAKMDLN